MKEYKLKTDTEWTQYDPNSQEANFMIETLRSVYGEDSIETREIQSLNVSVNVGPVITSPRHVTQLANNVDADAYRKAKERAQAKSPEHKPRDLTGMTLEEIQAYNYELARMGRIR